METPKVESLFVPATAGEVLHLGTIVSRRRGQEYETRLNPSNS